MEEDASYSFASLGHGLGQPSAPAADVLPVATSPATTSVANEVEV